MPARLAAALWAFAEATLFFVVPDVLLSLLAVARGWRLAAQATLWAIGGALLGGLAMYAWGAQDQAGALALVERLPAISPEMIAQVRISLAEQGLWPLFQAGVTGVPYKIFAASAPGAGIALAPFLLASGAARAGRFLLTVLLAVLVDRLLARLAGRRARLWIFGGFWVVFYILFWTLVPG